MITKQLSKGQVNPSVKTLQQILNLDPDTRVAATGPGSPGSETTKFGPATAAAVKKFQVKHGIAKPGEAGYGNLGPKTRAKLNAIGAGGAVPAASSGAQSSLEVQIAAAMAKIKQLQAELKALQQ